MDRLGAVDADSIQSRLNPSGLCFVGDLLHKSRQAPGDDLREIPRRSIPEVRPLLQEEVPAQDEPVGEGAERTEDDISAPQSTMVMLAARVAPVRQRNALALANSKDQRKAFGALVREVVGAEVR